MITWRLAVCERTAQQSSDGTFDPDVEMTTPIGRPARQASSTLACNELACVTIPQEPRDSRREIRQVRLTEDHILSVTQWEHHLDVAEVLTYERRAGRENGGVPLTELTVPGGRNSYFVPTEIDEVACAPGSGASVRPRLRFQLGPNPLWELPTKPGPIHVLAQGRDTTFTGEGDKFAHCV